MRIYSFPPVIDERARVLILGTAPSVKSLEHQQFYGHPQNFMWRIIYRLFNNSDMDPVYENRLAFLKEHRLALWDVIESCEREGSLDVNIRAEVPQKLPELVADYPELRCFAFNGAKAYDTFHKFYRGHESFKQITLLKLPSSSPIPTPKMRTLEDRVGAWSAIVPYATN
ncbi:TDG/mug DNA glycosylase family protein [Paenibacillus endophyticus]|uniref:TDG/mug DNA glycosylase family protein n=1 Tax=Paenibacillus endophyticus TaxID=1294268 RepID=A0A7W5GDJ0_9BACL|nr:DNA-deoxyinosine glycosylase [Paenibacillus endophyticus]MBB3155965.1 TDG/mug DNA glycosylase family protein [Paenibacillus endophyticus]